MREIGAAVILLLLTGQGMAAPPPSVPGRIMSLKICTDELLMDLAPPSRIASVTFLSRESAALKLWPEAARIPVNHNSAEEVLATRPDLILTDSFTSPQMRRVLARSGARVVEVPPAENFDQIRAVTRLVGDAVGMRPRAEALIARMDATLRDLAATRPARNIRVMGWGGGGFVPGPPHRGSPPGSARSRQLARPGQHLLLHPPARRPGAKCDQRSFRLTLDIPMPMIGTAVQYAQHRSVPALAVSRDV